MKSSALLHEGSEAMGTRIRLLIADDHASSRRGLRALLATCPTVEVVGEAENGREAVGLVETCRPDLVLMDLQMPVCDGLEATRRIKANRPEVKILILTIRETSRGEALSAGADGFLLKGCRSKELLAAIQRHGAGLGETQELAEGKSRGRSAAGGMELQQKRLTSAILTP
jgi:DNA-binding NarL/FixJ family response regulator